MSRPISRYPGDVPIADFFNYEDPEAHNPVPFILTGETLDLNVEVTFWDLQNNCEIIRAELNKRVRRANSLGVAHDQADLGSIPGDIAMVTGNVDLPGPGLYQLILKNPNIRKEAQPFWIFMPGPVCEQAEEPESGA